jgi:sporulation integral membrane protein YtvI
VSGFLLLLSARGKNYKNYYNIKFWIKPFSKGLRGLGQRPKVLGKRGAFHMNETTGKRLGFIVNIFYFAMVAALIYLAARYLARWLLPFIIGFIIAMILRPVVRWVDKRSKVGKKFAGGAVLLLSFLLVGLLLFWGGSYLARQLEGWFSQIPDFGAGVIAPALLSIENFMTDNLSGFFPGSRGAMISPEDLQGVLVSLSTTLIAALGGLTAGLPAFLLAFLFSIISSVLISMNYDQTAAFLIKQIPEKHRELVMTVKKDSYIMAGRYFTAYLKLMGITFIELAAGFLFLGVQNAILAALLIALFDLLPVLGTGGIMLPWALFSLLGGSYPLGIGLLVLYAIVTIVRNIIEPKIIGDHLGLSPLAALVAIYLGFKLMGVLGMIIFPIAAQILSGLQKSGVIKIWR